MSRALAFTVVLLSSLSCEAPDALPDGGARNRDGGAPAPPPCLEVIPSSVDFGEVEHPISAFRRVTLVNRTDVLRKVHALPRNSAFSISPLDSIDIALPPGAQRLVEVQFFTRDARLHHGVIDLTAGPDCDASITVRGLGSGSLNFDPPRLDFGFLDPDESKTLELRLTNTRRSPVRVDDLRLLESVAPAFWFDLPEVPFEVPAMSSRTFSITAEPVWDDLFSAELVAATGFEVVVAELRVIGGAPVVEVTPASVAIPFAPYEPSLTFPSPALRDLRVRNVSTVGVSLASALRLVPPFVRVEREDGGVVARPDGGVAEVEVAVLAGGIAALGPGEAIDVPVRVTPQSLGERRYRVRFFTNDPVTPDPVVALRVNAVTLGACQMQSSPHGALHLEPTPDGRARGTVSFVNVGTNRCVVDEPRLTATSSPEFSVLGAPEFLIVEPGATETLTIEGPRSLFPVEGMLQFHVLNSGLERQFIELHVPQ